MRHILAAPQSNCVIFECNGGEGDNSLHKYHQARSYGALGYLSGTSGPPCGRGPLVSVNRGPAPPPNGSASGYAAEDHNFFGKSVSVEELLIMELVKRSLLSLYLLLTGALFTSKWIHHIVTVTLARGLINFFPYNCF